MIVNGFKQNSEGSYALDQPVSLPVVDSPSAMSVTDSLLNIRSPQASLVEPKHRMRSPHEAFDSHCAAILRRWTAAHVWVTARRAAFRDVHLFAEQASAGSVMGAALLLERARAGASDGTVHRPARGENIAQPGVATAA